MVIPVTTIGGSKDDDKRREDAAQTQSLKPLTFKPTTMSDSASHPPAPLADASAAAMSGARRTIAPTSIGTPAPVPEQAPRQRVTQAGTQASGPLPVSGMGGSSPASAAPLEALARRFPQASPDGLARARTVLLSHGGQTNGRTDWLTYGVPAQTAVNAVLKEQVTLLESPARRDASAYVARLHAILSEVLTAMDGGLFRKSPRAVWEQHASEVRNLESLLNCAGEELRRILNAIADLRRRYTAAAEAIEAHYLAGEHLLDGMKVDAASSLLQSRLAALTASQALTVENRLLLDQQEGRFQELAVLIQDGVLVKLPSVITQLATLPDKPTDTDRYRAREALSNLTQIFERSRTWL